jgi:hypothetical protein
MDKLNHETIGELQGGGIGHAIDQAIGEALRDCTNRPGLGNARKVVIELAFKPGSSGLEDSGLGLSTIGLLAQVKTNFPSRAGVEEFLGVRAEQIGTEKVITARFAQATPLFGEGN